jgi:hypothetical protein
METGVRGNDLASRLSGFVHKPETQESSLETDISDEKFDSQEFSDFETPQVRSTTSSLPLQTRAKSASSKRTSLA